MLRPHGGGDSQRPGTAWVRLPTARVTAESRAPAHTGLPVVGTRRLPLGPEGLPGSAAGTSGQEK